VQTAELFLNEASWSTRRPARTRSTTRTRSSQEPGTCRWCGAAWTGHGQRGRGGGRRPQGSPSGNTLIVGQTTFGKGSLQGDHRAGQGPRWTRPRAVSHLTVAKLFSTASNCLHGRGVCESASRTGGDPRRPPASRSWMQRSCRPMMMTLTGTFHTKTRRTQRRQNHMKCI